MEHEVFVPVPAPSLRQTLGDPARVARCLPGFQQDADPAGGPLVGRLKVRVGGHTITYRGILSLTRTDLDTFSVSGEGTEARGAGAVKLALTVDLTENDGGTTIGFTGTVAGDGRLVDLGPEAARTAGTRLLDRFTQQLVTETLGGHAADAPGVVGGTPEPGPAGTAACPAGDAGPAGAAGAADAPGSADASGAASEAATGAGASEPAESGGPPADPAGPPTAGEPPAKPSVFDTEVPPSSLGPEDGFNSGIEGGIELEFTVPDEPPAEAAHARRTMIGRSAEEVDHAPPRGRYAPVPSADAGTVGSTLRWVAPAAALALASAVVVGRALRRRR
ncbi:SRPBCC domain-containing protein [uncultured Streptomyces sp.]|uniref:SRPBCC domain-containing protein n=1 Tax=uncultured Streptomyces sp. TaxID=174707 RepID=UPI00261EC092|nr:SRPBCC domain-containing protein [uncultured Streptomyces sp.]